METHFVITASGDKSLKMKSVAINALTKELVEDIGEDVVSEGKKRAPRRTGNLFKNIQTGPVRRKGQHSWEAAVGVGRQAPYGVYVEKGTGIYAGRSVIRPKAGNFLVFRSYPSGKLIVTPYVKGQRGQWYMRRAVKATNQYHVPQRLKQFEKKLESL